MKDAKATFLFERRAVQALALAFLSVITTLFVIFPPYWSLLDDGGFLLEAGNHFSNRGFVEFVIETTLADMRGWGMFRPVYYAYVYLFYGTFQNSSVVAYWFIAAFSIAIFWFWAWLFEKCVINIFKSAHKEDITFLRWLFFLLCLLFTPHYNSLFHASLQERFVVLFNGFAFWGLLTILESKKVNLISMGSLVVGSFLAFYSKLTFLFQMPIFTFWLFLAWQNTRKKQMLAASFIMLFLTIYFAAFSLSIRTSHTSTYQISSIGSAFLTIGLRFHIFFWLALIALVVLIWRWRFLKQQPLNSIMSVAFWPLSVISYLLVLLPWGTVAGYYLVPPGVFIVGTVVCLVQIFYFSFLQSYFWRTLFLFGTIIPLFFFAGGKIYKEARQHYGTGLVVQFLNQELDRSESPLAIRMPPPCLEAGDQISRYLGRPDAVKMISVNPDDLFWHQGNAYRKLLIINKECTEIPERFSVLKELFRFSPWYIYEGEILKT